MKRLGAPAVALVAVALAACSSLEPNRATPRLIDAEAPNGHGARVAALQMAGKASPDLVRLWQAEQAAISALDAAIVRRDQGGFVAAKKSLSAAVDAVEKQLAKEGG